jgi:hypothetical protein
MKYPQSQGSQTQIYRGPHLDGKSLCRPHYTIRRPLRAAMRKNLSYFVHNLTIFEHLMSFDDQNLQLCLFKRESRVACLRPLPFPNPAGRLLTLHHSPLDSLYSISKDP